MSGGGGGDDGDYSKMGFCSLFWMAFFWVCGGIYGGEEVMQLAPSGIVFSTLLVIMGIYALPIALINAELAVAIPEDGGLVVWVQKAFGSTVGGHNAWWVWASYIFDAAIYPVLAASYLTTALGVRADDKHLGAYEIIIAETVVILVTCMKLMGPEVVVKFAELASFVSLAPAVVFVAWGFATVDMHPERWVRWDTGVSGSDAGDALGSSSGSWGDVSEIQWTLLVSWMLWLNSGYLGLGALAAGVDNPKVTFPLIVITIIPFVACVIIAPFLVSLSKDDVLNHYKAGHFTDLAEEIAGKWLKDAFTVGAIMCMVALYANTIITSEVSLQYFVEERFPSMQLPLSAYATSASAPEPFPAKAKRWLLHHDEGSAAPVYILVNGAIATMLVLLKYEILIEFTMTVMGPPTLLFLFSFVALRINRPDMQRDFKIPGGTFVAILAIIPPVFVTCAQLYFAASGVGEGSKLILAGHNVWHPSILSVILVVSLGIVGTLALLVVFGLFLTTVAAKVNLFASSAVVGHVVAVTCLGFGGAKEKVEVEDDIYAPLLTGEAPIHRAVRRSVDTVN